MAYRRLLYYHLPSPCCLLLDHLPGLSIRQPRRARSGVLARLATCLFICHSWLEQLLQLQGGGQEQDDVSRKGLEDEGTGDRLWVETSSDWRDEKLVSEDDDMFETADLFSDVLNSSAEVRRQIYVYP